MSGRWLFAGLLLSALSASAATPVVPAPGNWLMMVKTESTDPARDAEFNAWYDDIDIPDVLEVPGYMRARRGLGQRVPQFPAADLQPAEGSYIALYDILSPDLDRTIAEMNALALRMQGNGRSTDLLRVTERIYYRQHGAAVAAPGGQAAASGKLFVYIERSDCRACESPTSTYGNWYDGRFLPAVLRGSGVLRATRYELYRVVMDPAPVIPRFLTVIELEADSAEQAAGVVAAAVRSLEEAGDMHPEHVPGDATVYLQIKDVPRPAGASS